MSETEAVVSEEVEASDKKRPEDKKEKKSTRSFVFSIIGIVLCIILLPILILNIILIIQSFTGDSSSIPNIGGTFPLMVKSGSMSPAIDEGDLIILHTTDAKYEFKKNEIVTFWEKGPGSTLITHRIVDVTTDKDNKTVYITRGDANAVNDHNAVSREDIVGVYQKRFSGVGRIALFMQTIPGIIVCVVLPLAIFVVYDILRRRHISKKEQAQTAALMAELESLKKESASASKKKDEVKADEKPEDKKES